MGKNDKFRPTFYIAHTFSERHFIRDELIPKLHKLGCDTLNPFYEPDGSWKEGRPEIKAADLGGMDARWAKIVKSRSMDIVETDLDLIRAADGIIAYMPEGSTGTTCEIWTCGGIFKWLEKIGYPIKEFLDKPVFLITTSSRLLMHPWIKYATGFGGVYRSPRSFFYHFKKGLPRLRQRLRERRNEARPHN
jgi:hypothetical protein